MKRIDAVLMDVETVNEKTEQLKKWLDNIKY